MSLYAAGASSRSLCLRHYALRWDHSDGETVEGVGSWRSGVVESHDGNAYRAVYTVRLEKAVYVLHAFQKKSPSGIRTAKRDVDLVAGRLKTAERDHEEHYGKPKR
jgi:phage-related protein